MILQQFKTICTKTKLTLNHLPKITVLIPKQHVVQNHLWTRYADVRFSNDAFIGARTYFPFRAQADERMPS